MAAGRIQSARCRDNFSPNAFKVPYLGVDGAFTIDTKEISATDPRNPKRVVFQQMELFSFYKDYDGYTPLAENCRYAYKGAEERSFLLPTGVEDIYLGFI